MMYIVLGVVGTVVLGLVLTLIAVRGGGGDPPDKPGE